MRLRSYFFAAIALALVACDRNETSAAAGKAPPQASFVAPERGGLPTLAPVLAEVFPTVVSISVQGARTVTPDSLLQDPVFRHFYGLRQGQVTERFIAAGSGVIIDFRAWLHRYQQSPSGKCPTDPGHLA